MKMVDLFVAQLEREAAISRRSLERVPEGRPDWKPHEKSMPLQYLSTLVASMPSWIEMAILQDELDLATGEKPPAWTKNGELLDTQAVALGDSILLTTRLNDREHENLLITPPFRERSRIIPLTSEDLGPTGSSRN